MWLLCWLIVLVVILALLVWFGLLHVGLFVVCWVVGLCLVLVCLFRLLFCVLRFANIVVCAQSFVGRGAACRVAVLPWCFVWFGCCMLRVVAVRYVAAVVLLLVWVLRFLVVVV